MRYFKKNSAFGFAKIFYCSIWNRERRLVAFSFPKALLIWVGAETRRLAFLNPIVRLTLSRRSTHPINRYDCEISFFESFIGWFIICEELLCNFLQEERQRIEGAGGAVLNIQGEPRVNGVLNISRSLGDIAAKPMVSSQPDTDVVRLTTEDRILLLSSDGIWETLSESEIAECIVQFVKSHPYSGTRFSLFSISNYSVSLRILCFVAYWFYLVIGVK